MVVCKAIDITEFFLFCVADRSEKACFFESTIWETMCWYKEREWRSWKEHTRTHATGKLQWWYKHKPKSSIWIDFNHSLNVIFCSSNWDVGARDKTTEWIIQFTEVVSITPKVMARSYQI